MNREEEILSEIRARLSALAEELRGHQVYLFGSRAAGTARARSDFDIGVTGLRPLTDEVYVRLQDAMDGIETLYRIDVVDLQRVSERFRTVAQQKMQLLYDGMR